MLDEDFAPQVLDEWLLKELTSEQSIVLLENLEENAVFHVRVFCTLHLAGKQDDEHFPDTVFVKQFDWKLQFDRHEFGDHIQVLIVGPVLKLVAILSLLDSFYVLKQLPECLSESS